MQKSVLHTVPAKHHFSYHQVRPQTTQLI